MTTSHQRGQPERGGSFPREQAPQAFIDMHKEIGIRACNFTFAQDLSGLLDANRDADSKKIISDAYTRLMAEVSKNPILKPLTDDYDTLDEITKGLFKDPAFRKGFEEMQKFLRELFSVIKDPQALHTPSGGIVTNEITIGGVHFEKGRFQANFAKDPRCLETAQEVAEMFQKRCPSTDQGTKMGIGYHFASFIFYAAVINFTDPLLDKLIAANPNQAH